MEKQKFWKNIDWLTVLIYVCLVIWGWVNIYAAGYDADIELSQFFLKSSAGKQIIWFFFAILIAWVILMLDMRFFSSFAYGIYGITLFSLIAVMIFGKEIAGARAWFDFGFFRVQPAEFAKVATALALARYLGRTMVKVTNYQHLLSIIGLIGLPSVLILFQNDTGSTLVFTAFIIALYREGLPSYIVSVGLGMIALLIATLLMLSELPLLITGLVYLASAIVIVVMVKDFWAVLVDFANNKKNQKGRFYDFVLELFFALSFAGIGFWWQVETNGLIGEDVSAFVSQTAFTGHFRWLALAIVLWLVLVIVVHQYKKSYTFFLTVCGIAAGSIFTVVSLDYFIKDVLKDYQQKRLQLLVNPELEPQGVGYQVTQSKIAIGSGGLSGKGFLQGTQTKFDFVPDQSTDFIFCTVGEEHGWLGSLATILMYLLLFSRILSIAERQKSRFSRVYAYCVLSILFFHFMVNIGMTIGIFPVIGIPLPYFSYGGSSLWAFTILLFVMIKVDAYRKQEILTS